MRSNYRTWILGLCYGYCFGVELTIDNNIASYFSDQFGKGVVSAGNYGAIFGLFNIISRPSGEQSIILGCITPFPVLRVKIKHSYTSDPSVEVPMAFAASS